MSAGYLIVTRFDVLYDAAIQRGAYDDNPAITTPIYGIPHRSLPAVSGIRPEYRGIDRVALSALTYDQARLFSDAGSPCEANDATALLDAIVVDTGREDGWVSDGHAIRRVWDALGEVQLDYEVIFAREYGDPTDPPEGAGFLGCDSAYFVADHFSCICDALFFPRRHGTDPEGKLFCSHFDMLNCNGLFGNNEDALAYLRYYLSFDWTERSDNFTSIEVYSIDLINDVVCD